MSLRKITALVMCLCRLHNFLITERIRQQGPSRWQPSKGRLGLGVDIDEPLAADALELATNGGIPLEARGEESSAPSQLMDGGHHHNDTTVTFWRNFSRRGAAGEFPRERLCQDVLRGLFQHPTPVQWQAGEIE